jgi:hypothetical protein
MVDPTRSQRSYALDQIISRAQNNIGARAFHR